MRTTLGLVVLLSASLACTQSQIRPDSTANSTFQSFLSEWEEAQGHFINGDPASWKEHTSQGGDATIFGAFGGYEKGWNEVGPRYDWASSQFANSGSTQKIEYLNTGVSGDLAFTVSLERQDVRIGEKDNPARVLRVTQVFRREGGTWKLLHRHADPLMQRETPSKE